MKHKTHKTMHGLLAVTCALFIGTLFTGCESVPTNDPSSPTGDLTKDLAFELVTKVAVSEALNGDVAAAQDVVVGTTKIINYVETGELATPSLVDDWIADWLEDSNLEPATKVQLSLMASTLRQHYIGRIDAGHLDPSVTAPIATVAKWVRDAAQDTIDYGEVQSYGLAPLAP